MALYSREEPLDRYAHHSRTAKLGHVAENVCRIKPLLGDAQVELLDQRGRDRFHDLASQFVFDDQLLVTLDRSRRQALVFGGKVECVLDVIVKHMSL